MNLKSTPVMSEEELAEYKKSLEEYYNIEFIDAEKWDKNYYKKEFPNEPIVEKGNKKLLKYVKINDGNFPIQNYYKSNNYCR